MKIKEIEFKLMFKTIFVIIFIFFLIFLISTLFDFLKSPFNSKKNDYSEKNSYTEYRNAFNLNQQTEYMYFNDYLDYSFCIELIRLTQEVEGEILTEYDAMIYVFEKRAIKLLDKQVKRYELNEDETIDFIAESIIFINGGLELFKKEQDDNQKKGIIKFCEEKLI